MADNTGKLMLFKQVLAFLMLAALPLDVAFSDVAFRFLLMEI